MAKKLIEDGQPVEKLTNKAEAVRRALANLGRHATPTEIQRYIKDHFGVEMTTKVISVYKSKMAKKKGAARRKAPDGHPSAPAALPDAISLRDLRALKELKARHGLSRLRELLELVSH
ncbi:MAG TPA: hypothetical protein VH575_03895 [Gemmataceae bacterium]|jgi:hypothetical protein